MTARALVPLRGRVYAADLGHGRKPFLVVSNNRRNGRLETYLAVRVTTSPKSPMPTVVPLGPDDPLTGRVLCDDVVALFRDELLEDLGALGAGSMRDVESGLRAALAL